MNRFDRINQLKEMISDLPVRDIAEIYFKKDNRGRFLCPYHNDNNGNSFHLNENQTFKCFACSDKKPFNIYQYLMDIEKFEFQQAVIDVAYKTNLIDPKEYDELTLGKKNTGFKDSKYQKKERKKKEQLQPLDEKTLHNIYSLFIKGNSLLGQNKLNSKHLEYLKEERHLTDEEIEKFQYFTYPKYSLRKTLFREYKKLGYDIETLIRVPGFYYDEEREEMHYKIYKNMDCIGIPIINENGYIVAIQLRRDKVEEGGTRYMWLSSANIKKSKIRGNVSSGTPIDVIYPDVEPKTIAITEGHFKAIKIAKEMKFLTLSVQGINNWKDIPLLINKLKQKYDIRNIIIMYDGDMGYKLPVIDSTISLLFGLLGLNLENEMTHLHKFLRLLPNNEEYNFNYIDNLSNNFNDLLLKIANSREYKDSCNISIALWDYHKGKGIDDLIFNTNSLKYVTFCNSYEFIYNLTSIIEEFNGKIFTNQDFYASFYDIFLYSFEQSLIDYKEISKEQQLEIQKEIEQEYIRNKFYNGGDIIVPF